ncbi:MAG: division/cell wall cluster transcriptional repressor MraZ [bacterium]|nr:division/cell wall cluster transcriptional repressor MraZ [bacterium]
MELDSKPMLTKFRGEKYHRIDDNFRLSMPRDFADIFRQASDGKIVIMRGFERSLWIYPATTYESVIERLSELPHFKKEATKFRTLYIGSITETELDKQGRIVIPKQLLQYAGIEQEIVLVGESFRIQVWSTPNWERFLENINTNADIIAENMSDLLEQQSISTRPLLSEKSDEDLSDRT